MESKLIYQEHNNLRQELHNLKTCQITFFSLAITSTGLLVGLGHHFVSETVPASLVFLSPLVIVLPCWCIFFDKATTITRIVGYYRILEQMIIRNENTISNYLGWENSLSKFRNERPDSKAKLLFSHTYWVITWITFFSLTSLCLTIGWVIFRHRGLNTGYTTAIVRLSLIMASALSFVAFIYTLYLAYNLFKGKFSYNNNEARWDEILSIGKNIQGSMSKID